MNAVAARVPPNSVRSGGKNTGKLFPMPPTSIMIANASQSRALARLSDSGVTRLDYEVAGGGGGADR